MEFLWQQERFSEFLRRLDSYVQDENKSGISEHEHFGPYNFLKIMTWNVPTITKEYFAGTIDDLKFLRRIIFNKLNETQVGESFTIGQDFGGNNTADVSFFVMPENFDPPSMDKQLPQTGKLHTQFTSSIYFWFVVMTIGSFFLWNLLLTISGRLLGLVPVTIQGLLLALIFTKHKYAKVGIKAWALIFLIIASGLQVAGQLLKELADGFENIDFKYDFTHLIPVILGTALLVYANKTTRVIVKE